MLRRLLFVALVAGTIVLAYAFAEARRDPAVRRARIAMADWPAGAKPVRAVLISDIHIGSPAMDERRLDRIVTQIDALRPDIVLIAGDFINGHEPGSAARFAPGLLAPLSRLHPPLGVIAVAGNHDYWTGRDALRSQLAAARVMMLDNRAILRGPLVIGGVSDDYTDHAKLGVTEREMRSLRGAPVTLTHSPDLAPSLTGEAPLVLAGHTHCGQIVLPFYGPLAEVSRFRSRYRCGLVREGTRTVIVTAGLGTSNVPLRLGAPPDLWLLTLGPKR
ncbi:metallophosphoesterase [Sphingomonas immobilis]|uniref:Metallophosphoesterase n=1 Tax=Sphingomonas immobilis TaxID=3063997 RepID=A0ABT8ZW04_9SPHN|nr:metallophosphoesterase [Sphingomonas sp. CA1-15]MDO7841458.1 metallophosphoesterase [Sphingomonas sp. CA1-15]